MKYGINTKLTIMFVTGVAAACLLQLWSFWAMRSIEQASNELSIMHRRVELTQHLNSHAHTLLRISSEYMMRKDPKKRDAFDGILKDTAVTLRAIGELPSYKLWDGIADDVRGKVRDLSDITINIVYSDEVLGSKGISEVMKKGAALTDEINALIEGFHEESLKEVEVLRVTTAKKSESMKLLIYVFLVSGAALMVFLFYSLRTRVTEPIDELYRGAKRLSRGDYVHDIHVKTGDELEHLAVAINSMAAALKEREEKLFTLLKVVDNVNKELMAANRHKSDFLSHVSHELKTPLTHVLGFSDLLDIEMEKTMTPGAKKYLENIKKGGKDLLTLIESLLQVAKSGEGIALELKEVSPAGLVHEVMEELMPKAKAKDLKVELDMEVAVAPGKLDVLMFKQIINNLFGNAIKFTPKGGTVRLRMSEYDDPKGNRRLKLTIEDSGIGIADELKPLLFNPFMIGESGYVREHGGIGMGLTLTRRFVEYHNGTINVSSEVGKGSKFDVDIAI